MLQTISAIRDDSLDLNEILDYALTTIVREMDFKFGAIVLFKDSLARVTHYINTGFPRELIQYIETVTLEDIMLNHKQSRNKVIIFKNTPDDLSENLEFYMQCTIFDVVSGVTLLLKERQKVLGLMHFLTDEEIEVTEDQIDELDTISGLLGLEVENAWLHEQTVITFKSRREKLLAINNIITLMNQADKLDAILQDVLNETLNVLNLNAGSLHLIDETSNRVELRACVGLPHDFIEQIENLSLHNSTVSTVLHAGKELITIELAYQGKKVWQLQEKCGIKRMVSVPLRAKNDIVGFVNLSVPPLRKFSLDEMYLLDSIGKQLGIIVENVRLNERVKSIDTFDYRCINPNYSIQN